MNTFNELNLEDRDKYLDAQYSGLLAELGIIAKQAHSTEHRNAAQSAIDNYGSNGVRIPITEKINRLNIETAILTERNASATCLRHP